MLERKLITKVLEEALTTNADFSEIFIEDKSQTSASMLSSKVERVNNTRTFGIGIRVAKGFHSVYG